MWQKKFTKVYKDLKKEDVWRAWSDVKSWPKWDDELEYCDMSGEFVKGTEFILKPKGGPKVKIILSEVEANKTFTDYCKFPGATMFDAHFLEDTADGLRISNIITVKGPLAFIWAHLVVKNVANSVPEQTDALVEYARTQHE